MGDVGKVLGKPVPGPHRLLPGEGKFGDGFLDLIGQTGIAALGHAVPGEQRQGLAGAGGFQQADQLLPLPVCGPAGKEKSPAQQGKPQSQRRPGHGEQPPGPGGKIPGSVPQRRQHTRGSLSGKGSVLHQSVDGIGGFGGAGDEGGAEAVQQSQLPDGGPEGQQARHHRHRQQTDRRKGHPAHKRRFHRWGSSNR